MAARLQVEHPKHLGAKEEASFCSAFTCSYVVRGACELDSLPRSNERLPTRLNAELIKETSQGSGVKKKKKWWGGGELERGRLPGGSLMFTMQSCDVRVDLINTCKQDKPRRNVN